MAINQAQAERLIELFKAAEGKPTKRPVQEIILSEREVAEKYIARSAPTTTVGEVVTTEE